MILRTINISIFLIASLFLYQKADQGHYYNWDAIPYVMAVHISDGKSIQDAHELTYKSLNEEVGEGLFQDLCCLRGYRNDQYTNPENLNSMLQMYALKPGYIITIKAFKNIFGLSEYQSMKYISIYSILILSFLFFLAFFKAGRITQFAWIPLIAIADLIFLSKLMTPDAITTLIFSIGLFALIKNKLILSFMILGLSMLFRPDMIVVVGLLGLIPALDKKYYFAAINSFIFLALYFLITSGSGHMGWWGHFYTSLIAQQSNLIDFNPEFNFNQYITIVIANLEWVLKDTNYIKWFGMNLVLLFVGVFLAVKKYNKFLNVVLTILCLSVFIKFALFPKVDARVYLAILSPACFMAFLNLIQDNRLLITEKK
ncbi:hypothetical protein N9H58_00695 [Gammaproteobacteria bacterium]|nr:hypothetical protein [Gammaproteobacteria bacterium]MDA9102394.1 hypothetical protein [Gammaproteobacteria bacterium]